MTFVNVQKWEFSYIQSSKTRIFNSENSENSFLTDITFYYKAF